MKNNEDKLKEELRTETRRLELERLEQDRPHIEAMSRAMHDYQAMLMKRYLADGLTHAEAGERIRMETKL
jgi:hypothetical protein